MKNCTFLGSAATKFSRVPSRTCSTRTLVFHAVKRRILDQVAPVFLLIKPPVGMQESQCLTCKIEFKKCERQGAAGDESAPVSGRSVRNETFRKIGKGNAGRSAFWWSVRYSSGTAPLVTARDKRRGARRRSPLRMWGRVYDRLADGGPRLKGAGVNCEQIGHHSSVRNRLTFPSSSRRSRFTGRKVSGPAGRCVARERFLTRDTRLASINCVAGV